MEFSSNPEPRMEIRLRMLNQHMTHKDLLKNLLKYLFDSEISIRECFVRTRVFVSGEIAGEFI